MANNADKVSVELEAKMAGFDAQVRNSANNFDQSMDKITRDAGKAEGAVTSAADRMGGAFLNASTRTRQLGIQIGQLGSSIGSGINPMVVAAQQASDFAYVLGGTGGVAGRLATFFSGPWGAALLSAGLVVGVLATREKEHQKTLEDVIDKMREQYRQTQLNEQADRIWSATIDGLTEAMKKRREEQEKSLTTDRAELNRSLNASAKELAGIEARRVELMKQLAAAQREMAAARSGLRGSESIDPSNPGSAADVAASQQRFLQAQSNLRRISTELREVGRQLPQFAANVQGELGKIAEYQSKLSTSTQAQINDQYDNLKLAARLAARGNSELTRSLEGTLTQLEKQRKAALDAAAAQEAQAKAAERNGKAQTAQFILPVQGRITSGFGPRTAPTAGASSFHPGIDIATPVGTPVKAAAAGVVVTTGKMNGLGNVVIVDHGGGTITEYGHLSAILAKRGDVVSQGDVIAKSGNTGISTGPHVDFRVRVGGKYVDPRKGAFPIDEVSAGQRGLQEAQRAQQEAERAAAREAAFNAELSQLEQQIIGASRKRLASADEQLAYAEADIIAERDRANASYEGAAKSGRISEAEAQILIEANNRLATARTARLHEEEAARRAALAVQLDAQRLQGQIDDLAFEVQMAKTGEERRSAQLRLLDAEQQLERIRLQQIIDATAAGTAEHELAILKLSQLDQERQRKTTAINQDPSNMSPGQRYAHDIALTAGQINEAMEGITVDGLTKLNDELTAAIMGTESLGEAFDHAASQIIAALIKIAIQQAIIRPLAEALFGTGSAGGGGGLVPMGDTGGSWLANLIGSIFTPKAGGGAVNAGQPYWVGENGPEPFIPATNGTIIPNHDAVNMGGSAAPAAPNVSLTVVAPGATGETIAMIRRELRNAAPTIVAAAQKATIANLTRQRP